MNISETIKAQITPKSYRNCWKNSTYPSFELFIEFAIKAFEIVIPKNAESLNVTINSTTENRINTAGSFYLEGTKQKIWGQIVWVPKPQFFRGKPGYSEVIEEKVIPEDKSTFFTRVNETSKELNGFGDEVKIAPKKLIEVFGVPDEADNFKVSGIYIFEGSAGTAYRLHDYEATTLYWDKSKYPDTLTPEDFWELEEDYCFSLVGNANPKAIKNWIIQQIENPNK